MHSSPWNVSFNVDSKLMTSERQMPEVIRYNQEELIFNRNRVLNANTDRSKDCLSMIRNTAANIDKKYWAKRTLPRSLNIEHGRTRRMDAIVRTMDVWVKQVVPGWCIDYIILDFFVHQDRLLCTCHITKITCNDD